MQTTIFDVNAFNEKDKPKPVNFRIRVLIGETKDYKTENGLSITVSCKRERLSGVGQSIKYYVVNFLGREYKPLTMAEVLKMIKEN